MKAIVFCNTKVLLKEEGEKLIVPEENELPFSAQDAESEIFHFDNAPAYRVSSDLFESVLSDENFRASGVREAYPELRKEEYALIVKGLELLNWSDGCRYCPKCGDRLRRATEISMKCDACGSEYFPTLSPAIVVLVTRDDGRALLVHARNFSRPEMYALVAGFVETGETLEECVAREVKEETSLEISDIKYFGSQSWPFPGQLMIGFTARYSSGELKFADGELSSGGWFSRDRLPDLPTPPSLSRSIIDSWISSDT